MSAATALSIGHIARQTGCSVPMVRERHLGERHQRVAQLLQPDLRAVSGDVARLLEPPEACKARARRQADGIGEIDVGDAAVLLQLAKEAQVHPVERGSVHVQPIACVISAQPPQAGPRGGSLPRTMAVAVPARSSPRLSTHCGMPLSASTSMRMNWPAYRLHQ